MHYRNDQIRTIYKKRLISRNFKFCVSEELYNYKIKIELINLKHIIKIIILNLKKYGS